MPKRKNRPPSDTLDEAPAAKSVKKYPNYGGKKKTWRSACAKPTSVKRAVGDKQTGISANWKTLSKSLGISCERKQPESNGVERGMGGEGDRGRHRRIGGGGRKKSVKESCLDQQKSKVFDDEIPPEFVGAEKTRRLSDSSSQLLVTGCDKSAGRHVGLDCEMVGTGSDGSYSMVARVCLVNHHGNVLLDTFVAPMDRITDYRTAISGVSPRDLHGAPEFSVVQKQVSELIKDRILVGHSVQNDLKALLLSHPKRDTRDTQKYRPFKKIAKTRYPSLKKLAQVILGVDIQVKEHNPIEDARAAMKLYQTHRKDWEAAVKARLTRREIRERRRERKMREDDDTRGRKWVPRARDLTPPPPKPFNIMLHTER